MQANHHSGSQLPLLEVEGLKKHFPVTSGALGRNAGNVLAVDGVSFTIAKGDTLGLVGESGSGKSTVGKSVLRLIKPTDGRIRLAGSDITEIKGEELHEARRNMQFVFQDPYSSLNPRMLAGDIVAEPLENYGVLDRTQRRKHVAELFSRVGLTRDAVRRYPHEFSGGQRQRLGVARALALNPSLIIADEPVSALDVSVQAQVLNLLMDLQDELDVTYLFISHDLAVVQHISHRVAVMYLGKIVELTDKENLFADPQHPYTQALLSAVPTPDPDPAHWRDRVALKGDIPSPINPPAGCHFHTRCSYAQERCRTEVPRMQAVKPDHLVACHLRTPPSAAGAGNID